MDKETWQSKAVAFVAKEREKLVSYVRRLIDDAADRDGEDIVQDIILNIFNRSDVSEPIEHLTAYIYQSIRNRVTDYLRKRKETLSLDAEFSEGDDLRLRDVLRDTGCDPENEELRLDIRRRLFAALDALEEDQRAVVIATEFEGHTIRSLAESWHVPVGTLLARRSRALSRIRKALAEIHES
jgi:RNA polymerase sigma factor (sigma-70 family)